MHTLITIIAAVIRPFRRYKPHPPRRHIIKDADGNVVAWVQNLAEDEL